MEVVERQEVHVRLGPRRPRVSELDREVVGDGPSAGDHDPRTRGIPPGAASGTTSTMLTATATRTIWVAQFRSHERAIVFRLPGSRDRSPSCHGERRQANVQVNGRVVSDDPCRPPAAVRPQRGRARCCAGDDARPPGRCGPRRDRGSRGGSAVRGRSPGRPRCRALVVGGRHGRGDPPPVARGCPRPSRRRPLGDAVRLRLRAGAPVPGARGGDQRRDRGVRAARRDRPPVAAAPDVRRPGGGGGRRRPPGVRVRVGADCRATGGAGGARRRRAGVPPVGPGDQSRRPCSRDGRRLPGATGGRRGALPREPPGGDGRRSDLGQDRTGRAPRSGSTASGPRGAAARRAAAHRAARSAPCGWVPDRLGRDGSHPPDGGAPVRARRRRGLGPVRVPRPRRPRSGPCS